MAVCNAPLSVLFHQAVHVAPLAKNLIPPWGRQRGQDADLSGRLIPVDLIQ